MAKTPLRGYLLPDNKEVWLDDFVEPGQRLEIREDFDDEGSPPIGHYEVVRVDMELGGWLLKEVDGRA